MSCTETAATAAETQEVPQLQPATDSLAEINKGLNAIFRDGQTIEVRAYGGKWGSVRQTIRQQKPLLHRGHQFAQQKKPSTQPFTRDSMKIPTKVSGKTAAAKDVTRRWWLFIDFDAIRPTGSSTDAEKATTFAVAKRAQEFLSLRGWGNPVVGDSGNGGHLLYRIDLPNTPEVTTLIRRTLEVLGKQFNSSAVNVDPTVYDASRITKAYGSMVRKGDNTPERPHRQSRILESGDGTVVTAEQLQNLVDDFSNEPEVETKSKTSTPPLTSSDMEAFFQHCGINWHPAEPHTQDGKSGVKYHIRSVPVG